MDREKLNRYKFQSTLPRRERHGALNYCFATLLVSIHAPTKGATYGAFNKLSVDRSFNPRSHEGSDCGARYFVSTSRSFNPRSHEGSDINAMTSYTNAQVSIHAPTKGATLTKRLELTWDRVSIHAPTKGATRTVIGMCVGGGCFNPRSHEGSDVLFISTCQMGLWFQSTLPRRERLCEIAEIMCADEFQSTLPRRERPCKLQCVFCWMGCFNPRSHEGSDGRDYINVVFSWGFNPRSHEGSDSGVLLCNEQ